MAGDEVTLKEFLTALMDQRFAEVQRQIAEASTRNLLDHTAVRAGLAEIKAHLQRREEVVDLKLESREGWVNSEIAEIKRTIYKWSGGIAVGGVVIGSFVAELVRRSIS